MSYTLASLDREVQIKVEHLEDINGKAIHKAWLVTAVMSEHKDIQGKDADFALCCADFTVEKSVDKYFRRIKQSETEETDPQLVLPGYKKLQKRYIVERNGEGVAVSPYYMTPDELDAKIEQHLSMAKGHELHAEELMRFKAERTRLDLEGATG